MLKDSLKTKLLDLYAQGDHKKIGELIKTSLGQLREKTLSSLESLLPEIDGKFRLKLLEILMTDGESDLIPLFIEAIRAEKNMLYAKSQILLFREFQHQEALPALLSLENEIDVDLKSTFQRTLGRLLSRFSEQFYMSEFRSGYGNPRRVKFAADMMLRSPHPDYIPFLNEQILLNDPGFRGEGLRALRELGDSSSIQPMFSLLSKMRSQRDKGVMLGGLVKGEYKGGMRMFEALVKHAGVSWSKEQETQFLENLERGEVSDLLEQVLDGYHLFEDVRRKIRPYLRDILLDRDPGAFEEARTKQALDTYLGALRALMHDNVSSMGSISQREEDDLFIRRIEQYLPLGDPDRDALLISGLSGFHSDESMNLLVEYVNTCEEPELLSLSMDALAHFPATEIPKGVEKYCDQENDAILRRKAMNLLGQWGLGENLIAKSISSSSIAVRVDAIQTAARFKLKNCYSDIKKLLKPNLPDSVLHAALEALRMFDSDQTGRAVRPFINPPHAQKIRLAALETAYKAGGAEGIDAVLKLFQQDNGNKLADLVDPLMMLILAGNITENQDIYLKYKDLFLALFERETNPATRGRILQMFENMEILEEYHIRTLISGLQKLMATFKGQSESEEEYRLRKLAERLENVTKDRNVRTQRDQLLQTLLDNVQKQQGFPKVQALRKLGQNYRSDLVIGNPVGLQRLIQVVSDCLDEGEQTEIRLQAIGVAGKIRHPRLHQQLQKLSATMTGSALNAVRNALNNPVDPVFIKPIHSIFVMDDSRYITKQLSKVLAADGFKVDFENDTAAGLERLGDGAFDLLVLDYIMPDMDGIAFLEEARRREVAPERTLIITSTRNQDELRLFVQVGIDGLILKPFRMEDFLQRIKDLSSPSLKSV
ncbi:Response regulator [Sulfidibacter corallicola]|uniref:Response regulator n=1 Tax=Sulfidibacter corallicola TaxID=2818388 RepID=A0A8A4TVR3_SULCO|nr:response regulator [Sulfidibacter corallicola]QTD53072.1 response regulator [Sulfidibacter corallicola]